MCKKVIVYFPILDFISTGVGQNVYVFPAHTYLTLFLVVRLRSISIRFGEFLSGGIIS